jgi:hypothetical protein
MIPMLVRTVDHDVRSGGAVAMLMPYEVGARTPLALPLKPADACTLAHELERQATPRARAYDLLMDGLRAVGGQLEAIVLEPGKRGFSASVRVALATGSTHLPLATATALGLAVHAALPVLVSERSFEPSSDATPTSSPGR